MLFFAAIWFTIIVGWLIHVAVDRHPGRRTGHRVVELALLWILVGGGAWGILGGLSHIGPQSDQTAEQIGYTQSMFQWEVGWNDIAVSVLGIGCAWRRLRGTWMTAAVTALAISFWGDAWGHFNQLVFHDNHAPANVWALPSDILMPLLAVILLIVYRRGQTRAEILEQAPLTSAVDR
ncbi:DUF6790 family protein [Catellatospora tritici]|uniref:DUF6790 family protein n=1 Tax=Catellatospora tritici TaxID=2851566 RepID=UPI001C2DA239|nr:DUF6790 family protein [Catellatospora tritici]MBV1853912.1 hypothetical protein [Catellatospora tritici]